MLSSKSDAYLSLTFSEIQLSGREELPVITSCFEELATVLIDADGNTLLCELEYEAINWHCVCVDVLV